MRFTRDTLLKLAKETVEKRFAHDANVTAVFLVGSLVSEEMVVENPIDVDLLVLHNGEIPRDREIIRLSNEFHLDIAYEDVSNYSKPRELRGDAWRGWNMWNPHLLFQRGRFLEYTQSVLRAQFEDPQNLIKRSRYFFSPAREAWSDAQMDLEGTRPFKFLTAVFNAGNSLAVLSGPPLPERKLLSGFSERANNIVEQDDLTQLIFSCLSTNINEQTIHAWLPLWESAFKAAAVSPADLRLHSARLTYYKSAIENQLVSDIPRAALWPMLHTWALAAENGTFNDQQNEEWMKVQAEAGLNPASIADRLAALDEFLDRVEEILDEISFLNSL